MTTLELTTPYGDRYIIHPNGNIQRTDIPDSQPSGQWRMLGLQHVKRREFIPLANIPRRLAAGLPLLWKNGSPQWTVRDYDHGSTRIWGNTRAHGVWRLTVRP